MFLAKLDWLRSEGIWPNGLREDLLAERGIDICHETVRLWRNRFGPGFAAQICRKRVHRMDAFTHWRWHLDQDPCEDQRPDAVPLAGGGSGRRGA